MTGRHPVPRIELVYVPNRRADGKALNAQPWHVRFVAGNGEPVSSTETFVGAQAALNNVLAHAVLFGWDHADVVTAGGFRGFTHELTEADDDGVHGWDLVLAPEIGGDMRVPVLLRVVES